MIDSKKTGSYIVELRKERNMTQADLASVFGVTFQAVSKWEKGLALPDLELLYRMAGYFGVSMEELVNGEAKNKENLTYAKAGVNIGLTDSIKKEMSEIICKGNPRILNNIGQFAALYDVGFPEIKQPVLVLKSEEPGSKQKLAFQYGYVESVCHDMINHLVNDIIVMGATPLAVLDTIICSKAEKETIKSIVKGISDACRENECSLVGGETSVQPGVVGDGTYILSSNIVGIVEKNNIIDGSMIRPGDSILAVESNGLHTNGYSLVRMLMDKFPEIVHQNIGKEKFIECILKPHKSYYKEFKGILRSKKIHGIAHITGGGIVSNLIRVLPEGISAVIDLERIRILPIFSLIKEKGNIPDEDMIRTFNLGVGMILVVNKSSKDEVIRHLSGFESKCYELGHLESGIKDVKCNGMFNWKSI